MENHELKRSDISESKSFNQDEEGFIDVGDIVRLDVTHNDNTEEMLCRLMEGYGDVLAEVQEISITSPIGAAIIGKKVGDIVSYSVDKREFEVLIKEKVKQKTLIKKVK